MSDFDDETLVAFLDGELPSETSAAIEQELGVNLLLRDRVDGLRQTWELLVDLPEERPNPELTRSTIEMVAIQMGAENDVWYRRLMRSRLFLMAIGTVTALLFGIAGGRAWSSYVAHRVQHDLKYIADFGAFQEIASEEWLEQLAQDKYLTAAYPTDSIGDGPVPLEGGHAADEWLANLDEIDRGLLEDNLTAYRRAGNSPELLKKVKSLVDGIYASENSQLLVDTARSYAKLLNSLPTSYVSRMKSDPPDVRLAKVQRIVNDRMRLMFAESMPASDQRKLENWAFDNLSFGGEVILDQYYDNSIERLVQSMSDAARSLLEPQSPEERRLSLEIWLRAVLSPTEARAIAPDRLLEKLQELNDSPDPAAAREQQRIELLPEEEAQRELREMIQGAEAAQS